MKTKGKFLAPPRAEALECLISWILQTEAKDFDLNPSDGHVYFHAYVVANGLPAANKRLLEAIKAYE